VPCSSACACDEPLTAAGVAAPTWRWTAFPDYVRHTNRCFGPTHPAVAAGRVTTVQAGRHRGLQRSAQISSGALRPKPPSMSDDLRQPPPCSRGEDSSSRPNPTTDPRRRHPPAEMLPPCARSERLGAAAACCCHNPNGAESAASSGPSDKIARSAASIPSWISPTRVGDGVEETRRWRALGRSSRVLVAMSSPSPSRSTRRVGAALGRAADSAKPRSALQPQAHDPHQLTRTRLRTVRVSSPGPPRRAARPVDEEIIVMRDRVRAMRRELVDRLKKRIPETLQLHPAAAPGSSRIGLHGEQMITMRELTRCNGIDRPPSAFRRSHSKKPRLRPTRSRRRRASPRTSSPSACRGISTAGACADP